MIRVLICDDNCVRRTGLRSILEDEPNVDVVADVDSCALDDDAEAPNGTTVLPRTAPVSVDREEIDLVLLGLVLPVADGLKALERISQRFAGRPVLVVGAHEGALYGRQVLEVGGSGYLSHRADAWQLVKAVRVVAAGDWYITPAVETSMVGFRRRSGAEASASLLSPRELEVVCHIAVGRSTREIAADLDISPKTVSTYRTRVQKKLDLNNDVEITHYALQSDLVSLGETQSANHAAPDDASGDAPRTASTPLSRRDVVARSLRRAQAS